jgi:hypothetical protein
MPRAALRQRRNAAHCQLGSDRQRDPFATLLPFAFLHRVEALSDNDFVAVRAFLCPALRINLALPFERAVNFFVTAPNHCYALVLQSVRATRESCRGLHRS